jgi:hypothetical protein
LANEEIDIGVRSQLAGVQPLPQCRALDQDWAEPLTTKGRGYTGRQALERKGEARLSKAIRIRAERAQWNADSFRKSSQVSGRLSGALKLDLSCRFGSFECRAGALKLHSRAYTRGMLEQAGERVDVVGRPRTHRAGPPQPVPLRRRPSDGRRPRRGVRDGIREQALSQNARVFGLDASADAVALARERVPAREFVIAELPNLPYPSERFNAIVSFETIEHVQDDAGFLAEATSASTRRSPSPLDTERCGDFTKRPGGKPVARPRVPAP